MPRMDLATLPIEFIPIGIPLADLQDIGANMTLTAGGWGSGTNKLESTAQSNNTTVTHTLQRVLTMPRRLSAFADISAARDETAAMADLTLSIAVRRRGTPASALNLDVQCYKSDKNAGAGSNLVGTGTVNLLSTGVDTWATHEFTIDGSGGIAAGDDLAALIRIVNNDTGGTGGGKVEIGAVWISMPVRGG